MVQKEGQKGFEQVFMYCLRTDANTSCVRIDSFTFTCKFSFVVHSSIQCKHYTSKKLFLQE
jgi:hypothetical protein